MIDKKRALITGITGQDGSYLAELLLKKGYEVHGLVKKVALEDSGHKLYNLDYLRDKITLHSGSIESYPVLLELFNKIKPDECYHLAAQSFVNESFEDSFNTFDINIKGTLSVLCSLKKSIPKCKFYFAGSSEMFGTTQESPQSEITPFKPRSPYGISKLAGFEIVRNFREKGLFACSGILFNHESSRRGYEYVTRKISKTIAEIKNNKTNVLLLGNLDAQRDWGYAKDYVKAMWLMLQQKKPDDYVIGTGENHSVQEFVDIAFKYVDLDYKIIDLHKLSIVKADLRINKLKKIKNKNFVIQYPLFYRLMENNILIADSSKARKELGWNNKIKFKELVSLMVKSDLNLEQKMK